MNLFDVPAGPVPAEITTILAQGGCTRVERIVSGGQTSDWYNQAESEFVALLAGSASITFADGKTVQLVAGDTLLIPPHKKHRVSYTTVEPKCIWLCVFFAANPQDL